MNWLKNNIFNKTQVAHLVSMGAKIFRMKLYQRNYNKFNDQEEQVICEALKDEIRGMEELHRLVLLEFCDYLSKPAIELLMRGQKNYVVEHYLSKK